MAAIDDLKTALQTLAADLSEDDVAYNKCLVLIDQYIDALTAQATTTSSDISSYSIGGRSVTRREVMAMQRQVSALERQINELLYSNISLADFSGESYEI